MPRKPDWSLHQPNHRLDEYRERVARLFRDEDEVGTLLVKVQLFAIRASGRLWWKQWGPSHDVLWLWSVVDGRFVDSMGPANAVDEELQEFEAGRFHYFGEVLRTQWLSGVEAEKLRQSFGVDQ
ncbi:MAG: hypothetical protein QOE24_1063 [Frankiales bacterium]|nr:hypothetical protein [Frankiales bacterium]